jgi:transposase InsO family protein
MLEAGSGTKFLSNFANPTLWTLLGSHKELGGALMKHKGEVFQHFLNFKTTVEKEKGVSIKCLRSNGGGEYFSKEFSEYLKEHGIQRKYSCSYSPQQNGVVEKKNRHIAEITRAMLNEKNLPNNFWAEVVATIVYIKNRTPTVTHP